MFVLLYFVIMGSPVDISRRLFLMKEMERKGNDASFVYILFILLKCQQLKCILYNLKGILNPVFQRG